MKTIEEHLHKITLCSDGEIRRLFAVDENLLFYDVPITTSDWLRLSGTKRYSVETNFLNGRVISSEEFKQEIG